MQPKTKIIATVGPACDSPEIIKAMLLAGVNIFRFNMKHNLISWHEALIKSVDKISRSMKLPISILIDLQGPEIRLETKNKLDISLKKGQTILFTPFFLPKVDSVCIPQKAIFDALKIGDHFLVDDGLVEFKVVSKAEKQMMAEVLEDAIIKNRKGVNLPGKTIDLPAIIDDDLKKLDMAAANKTVDFIALSFSRTKRDIEMLRQEMKKRKLEAKIIAKIESQPALDHLDELIESADGIMVARGDLGIEVAMEKIAYLQKQIIAKCRIARKPVITATQMLQSMIHTPRPTRAEATDVANAVYDGTDAVMLSEESATGNYPIKAVEAMAKICQYNENYSPSIWATNNKFDNTELTARAAYTILETPQVPNFNAIVVFTKTGYSAQVIANFRPKIPIIAVTTKEKTLDYLTLSYGVIPVYMPLPKGQLLLPNKIMNFLKKKKYLKSGQLALLIYGLFYQKPGFNNSITIYKV